MKPLLASIKSRFEKRPDSEHEQAIVRLAIVSVFLAYLFGLVTVSGSHAGTVHTALWYVLLDAIVGAAILVWLILRPGISHPRRVLGMLIGESLDIHVDARLARVTETQLGFAYERIPENKETPLWNLLGGYADRLEPYSS